ncbi:MAG: malto-oligosyltrehalose trehalohydrolase [Longimicrobiales bacterium]
MESRSRAEASPLRRLPVGAEVVTGRGVHFRVWAPRRRVVEVVLEVPDGEVPDGANHATAARPATPDASTKGERSAARRRTYRLDAERGGYFSALVEEATAGTLYRFRVDEGERLLPDPASRYQPTGPHGASQVIDPRSYRWRDAAWRGSALAGQIIYELHIGTFTPEGTWGAAAERLPLLAEVGISLIELLPVADFPGRFGWGYDGVNLFAPTRLYGTPDAMRDFIDAVHAAGIGVVLDVVYNHLGPDGNYLGEFAREYFSDRYTTDWGDALNFDGPGCAAVREYCAANVRYWIEELHVDGFRFDATQNIYDASRPHILTELARTAREAAGRRGVLLLGENEPQQTRIVRPAAHGGHGFDAVWNDDFHHSAVVALTGRKEAYYTDHLGAAQEFVSAAKRGFLYQGQYYGWQQQRRGSPALDLAPAVFVHFLENHDQIANSERGARLHSQSSPGAYRALTALLLLGPQTPMLFQGQEWGSNRPFLYFADQRPELAKSVRRGRAEFLAQFRSIGLSEVRSLLPDPCDIETFRRCTLDWAERTANAEVCALHRDLCRLRRRDPVFAAQRQGGVDGAVLSPEAFVLRYFGEGGDDRLLVINLGRDMRLLPAPEPLLAPPAERRWRTLWSSEDARYGGRGTAPLEAEDGWRLPGQCAVALEPVPLDPTT